MGVTGGKKGSAGGCQGSGGRGLREPSGKGPICGLMVPGANTFTPLAVTAHREGCLPVPTHTATQVRRTRERRATVAAARPPGSERTAVPRLHATTHTAPLYVTPSGFKVARRLDFPPVVLVPSGTNCFPKTKKLLSLDSTAQTRLSWVGRALTDRKCRHCVRGFRLKGPHWCHRFLLRCWCRLLPTGQGPPLLATAVSFLVPVPGLHRGSFPSLASFPGKPLQARPVLAGGAPGTLAPHSRYPHRGSESPGIMLPAAACLVPTPLGAVDRKDADSRALCHLGEE